MMIKASKLAVAITVAGPLAIATVGESLAAPVPSGAVTVKAPAAATEVQYRTYFDYGYGPYAIVLAPIARPFVVECGVIKVLGARLGYRRRQLVW